METDERIARLQSMIDAGDHEPLTFFLHGRECMVAGRVEEAATSFARCLEADAEYSAAYRFLGDCHRRLGRSDAAREVYERGAAVANRRGDLQAAREMETFLRKMNEEAK